MRCAMLSDTGPIYRFFLMSALLSKVNTKQLLAHFLPYLQTQQDLTRIACEQAPRLGKKRVNW